MRARFQCRALCGQATARCCHIKAVILTPLVKRYGTPPHIKHSVWPIAGTVRLDQWINGCIELQAESVGVPVFEEVLLSSSAGPHVKVILLSRCVCASTIDPPARTLCFHVGKLKCEKSRSSWREIFTENKYFSQILAISLLLWFGLGYLNNLCD